MNLEKPGDLTLDAGELIAGDVLKSIRKLPDEHFQLVVSSPPYNIGKSYERDRQTLKEYAAWQRKVCREVARVLKPGGSVCWQVGSHVRDGVVFPLDFMFYDLFSKLGLKLRNRIVWRFNFGLHADRRFSGRYETVLWFSKGDDYKFNLDPVRVPQLYPGKRHAASKPGKGGLPSGNPLGKNPADYWEFSAERDFRENPVWDFPNVKAKHPERTEHPCQFPIELVERCVLALTDPGDRVLDPFVGTGASVIAAIKHARQGTGIDRDARFLEIAQARLAQLNAGTLPMRELGKPVKRPDTSTKVAQVPEEWLATR
ncbi:site-specific DNA-methyltransferase [Phenylobacterium sp.]|uniref:DNA-methyltransferase n=1 Tax=Phenylobacterium sp. TaxID=1871053 RepID=UPI0025E07E46|nr:site-specific DNA-methyltransferase [Phenylobacterium sp.]MBX3483293.1 site-specific DNA-methyltransferase [Phenylobacterium sp.]